MFPTGGTTVLISVGLCVLLSLGTIGLSDATCTEGQSNYTIQVEIKSYLKTIIKYVPHNLEKTECCPGFSMNDSTMCIKHANGCSIGMYGDNCSMNCSCPENAFDACDVHSGHCTCSPGYEGPNCTVECENHMCGSCICYNGNCTTETGQCHCYPGWNGTFCEKGISLCNHCCGVNWLHNQLVNSADPDETAPEEAVSSGSSLFTACSNTYGQNCSVECDCNTTQVCDHVTGNCTQCKPGWTDPPLCETVCPDWTFGTDCHYNCSCDKHNSMNCSNEDGRCYCKPGYEGTHCENKCRIGTYGEGCAFNCTDCDYGICDHENGTCMCFGNKGDNCTEGCPGDHYGADCNWECQCNTHHSNGTCGPCSGACECDPGWTGFGCDIECPGYVDTCQSMKVLNECDPINARLQCTEGWTGYLCTEPCPFGYYGQNCSSQCNCTDNLYCNQMTGACICPPGKTGDICSEDCKDGRYGFNCSSECNCSADQVCNGSNGECHCKQGYAGEKCDADCPSESYGYGCSMACNCSESQSCHHVNGSCDCIHGWDGDICAKDDPILSPSGSFPIRYIIMIAAGGGAVIFITAVMLFLWTMKKRNAKGREKTVELEMTPLSKSTTNKLYDENETLTKDVDTDIHHGHCRKKSIASVVATHKLGNMSLENRDELTNKETTHEHDETAVSSSANGQVTGTTFQQTDVHKIEAEYELSDDEHYADVVNDIQHTTKPTNNERQSKELVEDSENKTIDDEYYTGVDGEAPQKPKAAKSVRATNNVAEEVVHIDDVYDRCDIRYNNALPKSDNTYDTFEDVKKAETTDEVEYDIVDRAGTSVKKKNFPDQYSTFAQIKQLSMEEANDSDSYDNFEFQNQNDSRLRFVTDIYNVAETKQNTPTESNQSMSTNDNCSGNDLVNDLDNQEYDSPLFDNGSSNRVSEVLYEECPTDEVVKSINSNEDNKCESNVIAHGSMYEEVPPDVVTMELNGTDDKLDEQNGISEPVHNKAKSHNLQKMESYENVDLPPALTKGDDKENGNVTKDRDRISTLRSKDRKAVDYEDFHVKF